MRGWHHDGVTSDSSSASADRAAVRASPAHQAALRELLALTDGLCASRRRVNEQYRDQSKDEHQQERDGH
jgi:hypothetical protein